MTVLDIEDDPGRQRTVITDLLLPTLLETYILGQCGHIANTSSVNRGIDDGQLRSTDDRRKCTAGL